MTPIGSVFDVFYGDLQTAPMIRECPVCMECVLDRIVDFPEHDLFVGEIRETYAHESVLTDGRVDLAKLKPLLFDMASKKYWALGPALGSCWDIGRQLKKR